MKVQLIFRKKSNEKFSIERVFELISQSLKEKVDFTNTYLPFESKDLTSIIKNIFYARSKKSEVYHITGDITYAAMLLPPERTVITIHDVESFLQGSGIKRWIKKMIWLKYPLNRVKYVTAISEFSKNQIQEICGIDSEKIRVIYNPVPASSDSVIINSESNKITLLQIGTKKNKNLHRLIESMHGLDCRIIIVGKLDAETIRLLEKFEIEFENKVNLEFSEVVACYKRADIVTFVSTYEGFGMPIIEAQTYQRAVLTSRLEPMVEVAGEGAYFVDPFDVNDIRKGLNRLMTEIDLRNDLIEKGNMNTERFTSDNVSAQYLELYKEVIS